MGVAKFFKRHTTEEHMALALAASACSRRSFVNDSDAKGAIIWIAAKRGRRATTSAPAFNDTNEKGRSNAALYFIDSCRAQREPLRIHV